MAAHIPKSKQKCFKCKERLLIYEQHEYMHTEDLRKYGIVYPLSEIEYSKSHEQMIKVVSPSQFGLFCSNPDCSQYNVLYTKELLPLIYYQKQLKNK